MKDQESRPGTPKPTGQAAVNLNSEQSTPDNRETEEVRKRKERSPDGETPEGKQVKHDDDIAQSPVPPYKMSTYELDGAGVGERSNGIINNAILAYITFSMQSGTQENIRKVALGSFTGEEIAYAKSVIWNKCDTNIIGKKITRQTSSVRSAEEANISDIMSALSKLDQKGKMPEIVISATKLGDIPRIHPEDLNAVSHAQRMNDLELKTEKLINAVETVMHENAFMKSSIKELKQNQTSNRDNPRPTSGWENMHTEEFKWPDKEDTPSEKPISDNSREDRNKSTMTFAEAAKRMATVTNRGRGRGRGGIRHQGSLGSLKPQVPAVLRLRGSNLSVDNSDACSETNESEDSFRLPKHQERKNRKAENKRRKFVEGKVKVTKGAFRGAPEPKRDLFIYRVDKETEMDDLKSHIGDQGFTIRDLVLISHKEAAFKSYKLSVPVSEYNNLFDDNIWPEGVRIRKFVSPPSSYSIK